MSDQKFLNKVKEFAHSLDHKYEIKKFKLKESYSESILAKAYIGGSRGGDCWGGHTCQYEENDRDIVDRMKKKVVILDHGRLARDIKKGGYYNERA